MLLTILIFCLTSVTADIDNTNYIPVEPSSVDCYRCRSFNFSDRNCHDPFEKSNVALVQKCQAPMGSPKVQVPANNCIKIIATSEITKAEYIVRDCVLDVEEGCDRTTLGNDIVRRCMWICQSGPGCNGGPEINIPLGHRK